MMHDNPFSDAEIERRLSAFRAELNARKLDGAVVAAPENVFYLTGLDHWGYFAPHLLIVPWQGTPVLVTRAMERVSVEKQVRAAEFRGHSDSETAADMAARVLRDLKLSGRHVGLEYWTSGLSHGFALSLIALGLFTVGLWNVPAGLFVGTVVVAFGHALAFPSLMTLAVNAAPASERSSVVGTFSAFTELGFLVGALSLGAVAAAVGYDGVFVVCAFGPLLGSDPSLKGPKA